MIEYTHERERESAETGIPRVTACEIAREWGQGFKHPETVALLSHCAYERGTTNTARFQLSIEGSSKPSRSAPPRPKSARPCKHDMQDPPVVKRREDLESGLFVFVERLTSQRLSGLQDRYPPRLFGLNVPLLTGRS